MPPMKSKKIIKYLLISIALIVGLGVVYYFFFYIPGKVNVKNAADIIENAEEDIQNKEYFNAVDKYKEASEKDSGSAEAYIGLAEVYLLKNRQDDAIEILQVGVNKAREKSEVYELLGQIYLNNGDYSKAIYFLKKAVGSDKDNDNAKLLLAQSYVGTGDLDKAKSNLNVSEDDKNLFARASLLKSMLVGDEIDESKEILDEIDLTDVEDEIADQVEFFEGVISDIENLDEDIKSNVYVDVMISRGALFSEYPDLVIGLLSDYSEEKEVYWELNLYLGHAYLMKNDFEKALEFLSQAYLLNSDSSVGIRLLARAYLGDENDSEMIKYYEKAINLAKGEERIETRLEYFNVLIMKEQFARAEEQLDFLLISDDMDTDELLILWGDCLLDRELYSQLEENMSRIKLNNLDEDLQAEYHYLQAGIGYGTADWDQAIESILNANEIDEKVAKYHLLYGKILYQTGVDIQATEELEKAVELDLEGEVSTEAKKVLDLL